MVQIGYCTNVGKCDLADKHHRVLINDRNSMLCASCGKALYILPENHAKKNGAALLIGGVLIGGACLTVFSLYFRPKPPDINQVPTSTSMAEKAVPQVPSQSAIDDLDRIQERRTIRVGVQGNAKPFFFTEGNRYSGFNIEFLNLLVKQEELRGGQSLLVSVDRKTDTYPDVPKTLTEKNRTGGYDVDVAIDGLTFLDGEEPGVVYTNPYIENFGYCLITKPQTQLHNIESLGGKKIGVLKGDKDVLEFVKQRLPGVQIVQLSDALINGERVWIKNFLEKNTVDAIVYDYPFATAEIDGQNLSIPIAKIPGSDIKYKIGLRDGNPKLRAALNLAISKVVSTPQYSELLRKYFSSASAAKVQIRDGARTYRVMSGDRLYSIAEKTLGRGDRFREIEQLNNLPNPNFIEIGQKLILPER